MSIGRGCAVELARFGALAAVYIAALGYFFPGGGTLVAALLCSLFALFLVNALQETFVPSADQRAIARALDGIAPASGARVAVSGQLVPIGDALTSPLGGSPCVAYSYWIGRRVRSDSETPGTRLAKDFRGFANAPCAVQTVRGNVGLRGLSSTHLDAFHERSLRPEKARARARPYLSETRFEPDPGQNLGRVLPAIRQVFAEIADPPLASRQDFGDPEAGIESDRIFSETLIPEGQVVTAIGAFASESPELRPRGVQLLTLLPGGLEEARKESKTPIAVPLMALAMFIMAHAMLATAIHGGAFD